MSTDILVMPALGRPFTIGMLYDARQDQLVPGFTLWDDAVLEKSTLDCPQPSNAFEVVASDTIDSKSIMLQVEASLKASFLGGLFEVGGSAKFMHDTKKFVTQSRVTLQYKATTNFKQLMTNLGSKHIKYSQLFENIQATHVVIGILYGANAFFVFDSDKVDYSTATEVQGSMQTLISLIPRIDVTSGASFQLSSAESSFINSINCKFHGDVFLPSNPTNFIEALETYQKLPQLVGKQNTVPVKVWLVPLKNFYAEAPQLAADISSPILRKTQRFVEALIELEMRCNVSLEDKLVRMFPEVHRKLYSFRLLCNDYMLQLRQTIAKNLLALRRGEEDETSFLQIFEENLESPFNIDSLNMWLDCEEKEINVIRSCVDIMERGKPKFLSSHSDIFKELFLSGVQHGVCFTFSSVVQNDPYLTLLTDYMESHKRITDPEKLKPPAKDYWFASDDTVELVREKARLFGNLAKEMNNRSVTFLVTVMENQKQKGAFIHQYRQCFMITDQFNGPHLPPVETIQDRRQLLWFDSELTLDPNTAHPRLTLSANNKTAESGTWHGYADNPERFQSYQQVLCKEGLSGRHYWEIEWSGYVRTGLTYRGIERKSWSSHVSLGHSEQSWVFDYYPPHAYAFIHKAQRKSISVSSPGFKRLGIYLDWLAGTLSFYMVTYNKVTHIYTVRNKFNEAVYPGFYIGFPGTHKNGRVTLL